MHRLFILIVLALFAGLACAKEVARFEGPAGAVVLSDDSGTCTEGAKSAMWIDHRGGPNVPGCWFEREGTGETYVLIAYEDGDRVAYHKSDFQATP